MLSSPFVCDQPQSKLKEHYQFCSCFCNRKEVHKTTTTGITQELGRVARRLRNQQDVSSRGNQSSE